MIITLVKPMDANIFGTPAYLKSRHADLQQKWVTHSERVEELWRFLTPSQREAVFQAGVKHGKVLKDPNDQSMFRSFALFPEMNTRDISGSPDYFLNRFEFRAATSLTHQYRIGLEGAKGDHQVIMESMVVNEVHSKRDFGNELMFFMDEDKYGDIYKAKGEEDYKQVLNDLVTAVKAGVVVPGGVGELILERQSYLIQHLCVLADDILKLGAIIDNSVKEYITPEESARTAFSTYPKDLEPQPICVLDLLTAAIDRKSSFEAYWDLCRSDSAFLANAVNLWYSTRPDFVPDEKGRRMPLASDEYVSRAIFEVIHRAVIGIAIWDILYALVQNFLEPLDDPEQGDIFLQEISNICHYEYDRVRKDFKRFAQVSCGSKHFKRLSKVFDNGTPRVVLKAVPGRVIKEDPQLHYILRLCQPENGVAQAVRWNNMLQQLHHNQPLEQDKLEEWEFDALGEVSLTINLVNTFITSLELPSASPKKGLRYISKLKELMARLEPLKTHTKLRRLPISLDDLKDPDTAKEALSIVGRFSEYYAGGSMVSLYQNLNKEFLEDLEVQLQEAKGTKKMKTKQSSTKSAGARHPTTQRQGVQAGKAHPSHSSLAKMSRDLVSFLKAKSKVPTGFQSPDEWGISANPEPSARPDTFNELDTSTDQDVPTYSPTPTEVEVLNYLLQQSPQPQTLADTATTEPLACEISAALDSSTEPGLSARSVTPTESEASEQNPVEDLELSAEAQLQADADAQPHADLEETTESTTAENELFIGPDPYAQLSTAAIMEVIAELDLSGSQTSEQPEISAELNTRTTITMEASAGKETTEDVNPEASAELKVPKGLGEPGSDPSAENTQPELFQEPDVLPESESRTEPELFASEDTSKLESEAPIEPETPTKSDTVEEPSPEVLKVSPSTLEVFATIFTALEESESNSGCQPKPEYSIKWLDFGAAMVDIGFTILPSVGSLYTFVPGKDCDQATFLTLHRPYGSVIHGDGLLLLALRLKLMYGWGKETFEAE
jgi:hypothetical protein